MEDFMGYPGERGASTSRLRNGVDPIELGQNAVHYLTIDVGQSKVAAGIVVREPFMVEPQ